MLNYNVTVPYKIPEVSVGSQYRMIEVGAALQLLRLLWSFFTISRVLVVILIVTNLKSLPLIWHLRIVNAFRFICKTQRPETPVGPEQLFLPLITTSHAPIMEIDFNGHKSNSSYFSDIDIARTHLVCTLFAKGISHFRGGTTAITGSKYPLFGLALGAVSCSFKRELKPYETYEMWSRVLSWDEKWIYIVTHFVRKDVVLPRKYTLYPEQNEAKQRETEGDDTSWLKILDGNKAVVATALSKCVFKSGRRTVSPMIMLRESGLLPAESASGDNNVEEFQLPTSTGSSDSGIDIGSGEEEGFSLAWIEKKRLRGMKAAIALGGKAQTELEQEFTAENDALGRHSDGSGIVGVVSTLAELAHLPACKGVL
ncbi:Thioesterase/thiol ester dehydrase-isomerase [Glarea lozoyensis ATCC 20868]|uniref:Thioesterase/thiol ester dehydrase-isomerase n=1 Tax=Glarea lozoyensis (strain ATCC 20868 / MF5171) TaxID=1116229 RepID=S3CYE7_GLAL2|nr:Thioesterase/thiol ester dehydrase-isomerase [Glarea lozoyensis ATCC 20868]EPE30635.1 Thioesterase/thiol ester dehydrase-isomerase [Glarea lozoyensis ATCC 20868]